MSSASIIFMGTPQFSLPSLEILHGGPYQLAAIVTPPDRPRGRGLRVNYSPVKQFALQAGIRVLQPANLKSPDFGRELENLGPDLIVTVAYGKILPPALLKIPALGAINLHASLLPAYRGAAPINRAVMDGASVTGVSVIQMSGDLDGGDIILQAQEPILIEDTAGSLHDRLAVKGSRLLLQAVEALVAGTAVLKPQDPSLVSYAPPLKPEEERINWSSDNYRIYNQIRGLAPGPGAHTIFNGRRLKLLAALPPVPGGEGGSPGEVIRVSQETITVGTADGTLNLLKVQPEGRSVMAAGAFSRGYQVKPGFMFG